MTRPADAGTGLTAETLRGLLHYDPETGAFAWRQSVNQTKGAAGWCNPKTGYLIIKVLGRKYTGALARSA